MIEMTVVLDVLRVSIPQEMESQALMLLEDLGCVEVCNKSTFMVKMTQPVREFVEKAKFDRHFLVYV